MKNNHEHKNSHKKKKKHKIRTVLYQRYKITTEKLKCLNVYTELPDMKDYHKVVSKTITFKVHGLPELLVPGVVCVLQHISTVISNSDSLVGECTITITIFYPSCTFL